MSEWVQYFEKTRKKRNLFNQSLANRRLIRLIIKHTQEKGRILEVGCGTAILSLLLADYGFDVTASDLGPDILDYARERISLKEARLDFVVADILRLSDVFPIQYFHTVCHKGVMEHFSDVDIVKGLTEQRKVSHKVIFCVPNNRGNLTDECFGDERLLSSKRWKALIREAGFTNIKVFGDHDFQRKRIIYFLLPGIFWREKLSFWWKYVSRHFIFVCE